MTLRDAGPASKGPASASAADGRGPLLGAKGTVRLLPFLAAAVGVGIGIGIARHRVRHARAETARLQDAVAGPNEGHSVPFAMSMVADLPDIAQRYFRHAIAEGTPLLPAVNLEMTGTFLLGSKERAKAYRMIATESLRPPEAFVWSARLAAGAVTVSGSDGLVDGSAWTRFWLAGLLPVEAAADSPDLVRSAQFRCATEAIWCPVALLPANGVGWRQVSDDRAAVTFERLSPPIEVQLTLSADGQVLEFVGMRWTNANDDHAFRLQPFGGTVDAEGSFEGYTIPVRLSVGNQFGTRDYHPFFQTTVTRAWFPT